MTLSVVIQSSVTSEEYEQTSSTGSPWFGVAITSSELAVTIIPGGGAIIY